MRRGFNPFSGDGQQDSQSNPNDNRGMTPFNYNLINQFSNFSPTGNLNQGIILSLFQIVEQQSRALQSLTQKVQSITSRTIELTDRIKQIKTKKEERQTDMDQNKSKNRRETIKAGDILEASQLIRILFGSDKKYEYKLRLAEKLDLPLYRERNFFLKIELTDLEGNVVKNSNKIPLSLAVYSSQNPPKFIEKNTAGQKILKGYIEQSLHQSVCRFEKIQIKQVTSHFRNGWVFLVIIPSMTPLGCSLSSSDTFIDYSKIEPLVLDRIVVKAKKLKDRKGENKEQCEAGQGQIDQQPKQEQKEEIEQK